MYGARRQSLRTAWQRLRWASGRERLVTVEELAQWLGVPTATIYRWRYHGDGPPSYKVGRHVRFRAAEVEEWLTTVRSPGDGVVRTASGR